MATTPQEHLVARVSYDVVVAGASYTPLVPSLDPTAEDEADCSTPQRFFDKRITVLKQQVMFREGTDMAIDKAQL